MCLCYRSKRERELAHHASSIGMGWMAGYTHLGHFALSEHRYREWVDGSLVETAGTVH